MPSCFKGTYKKNIPVQKIILSLHIRICRYLDKSIACKIFLICKKEVCTILTEIIE